ncbi:serine-repeat antigen [Plakobranchus ocellatus]|uniref:Serine-repeat antigen n=1 Tax=Plakobranchus ocellatus TaxID=259542 RepID=A0AAV4D7L8_9GAST|nr:serine-repeat antigen [Plakobranchus ocellatus]
MFVNLSATAQAMQVEYSIFSLVFSRLSNQDLALGGTADDQRKNGRRKLWTRTKWRMCLAGNARLGPPSYRGSHLNDQPTNQQTTLTTNQSTNQPTEPPTNQQTSRLNDQPTTNQPSERPTNQAPKQKLISQPTRQPINQAIKQVTKQASKQTSKQATKQPTKQRKKITKHGKENQTGEKGSPDCPVES